MSTGTTKLNGTTTSKIPTYSNDYDLLMNNIPPYERLRKTIEEAAAQLFETETLFKGSGLGLLVRPCKPRDFHRSA